MRRPEGRASASPSGSSPVVAPVVAPVPPGGLLTTRDAPRFDVHLDVFTGPFDLLLGLITKKQLDVTEVALAEVTDDFVAHARRLTASAPGGGERAGQHLGQVSAFCVVAATLLELKAARLLPGRDVEDVEDVELLEARDLLFARLLQHRAYTEVAAELRQRMAVAARAVPRPGVLDPGLAAALPPLELTVDASGLASLAAAALARVHEEPAVATDHLHAPSVSVPEQVALLTERLAARGSAAFEALVADATSAAVVVGRFLALLELHRRSWVDWAQDAPMAPLLVQWRGEAA